MPSSIQPSSAVFTTPGSQLKEELIKWKGSIIFVSHEAVFYQDWADKIIHIGT